MLAAATGLTLTHQQIDAIHARKMEIACAEIVANQVKPRPGVVALAHLAKDHGMKLGFVTTTYQPNIDAIFAALGQTLAHAFGDRGIPIVLRFNKCFHRRERIADTQRDDHLPALYGVC